MFMELWNFGNIYRLQRIILFRMINQKSNRHKLSQIFNSELSTGINTPKNQRQSMDAILNQYKDAWGGLFPPKKGLRISSSSRNHQKTASTITDFQPKIVRQQLRDKQDEKKSIQQPIKHRRSRNIKPKLDCNWGYEYPQSFRPQTDHVIYNMWVGIYQNWLRLQPLLRHLFTDKQTYNKITQQLRNNMKNTKDRLAYLKKKAQKTSSNHKDRLLMQQQQEQIIKISILNFKGNIDVLEQFVKSERTQEDYEHVKTHLLNNDNVGNLRKIKTIKQNIFAKEMLESKQNTRKNLKQSTTQQLIKASQGLNNLLYTLKDRIQVVKHLSENNKKIEHDILEPLRNFNLIDKDNKNINTEKMLENIGNMYKQTKISKSNIQNSNVEEQVMNSEKTQRCNIQGKQNNENIKSVRVHAPHKSELYQNPNVKLNFQVDETDEEFSQQNAQKIRQKYQLKLRNNKSKKQISNQNKDVISMDYKSQKSSRNVIDKKQQMQKQKQRDHRLLTNKKNQQNSDRGLKSIGKHRQNNVGKKVKFLKAENQTEDKKANQSKTKKNIKIIMLKTDEKFERNKQKSKTSIPVKDSSESQQEQYTDVVNRHDGNIPKRKRMGKKFTQINRFSFESDAPVPGKVTLLGNQTQNENFLATFLESILIQNKIQYKQKKSVNSYRKNIRVKAMQQQNLQKQINQKGQNKKRGSITTNRKLDWDQDNLLDVFLPNNNQLVFHQNQNQNYNNKSFGEPIFAYLSNFHKQARNNWLIYDDFRSSLNFLQGGKQIKNNYNYFVNQNCFDIQQINQDFELKDEKQFLKKLEYKNRQSFASQSKMIEFSKNIIKRNAEQFGQKQLDIRNQYSKTIKKIQQKQEEKYQLNDFIS